MGIKLSAAQEPRAGSAAERLQAAFLQVLQGLLAVFRGIFLPHLLASMGLFTLAGYAVYKAWLGPVGLPAPFSLLAAMLVVGAYGALALLYALAVSLVFAIGAAAGRVEDFLYEVFASLKDKVRGKIDAMEEGVAKRQAKVILDNSVREVFAPLKACRLGGAPGAAAGVFLSLLTYITRSVFLARLARLSGATVNFSAVFASRATLVGALFLNLRWLAAAVLWLFYALGALTLLFNLWLVW